MREPNRRVRWGQLQATGQSPYQLTGDDVIWAGRSALYEGGDVAATLWTLTQRYMGAARTQYPTFAAFVQAFSQPVNPKYTRWGEYCTRGGRAYGTKWCSEELLQRRDEARNASWIDLILRDEVGAQTVLDWANGDLPNPVPRAVNFADRATVAKNFPSARVILDRGNLYIAEPWSHAWARTHVAVTGSTGAYADANGTRSGSPLREALAVAFDAVVYPWRVRARA